jgi:hypothetical protein
VDCGWFSQRLYRKGEYRSLHCGSTDCGLAPGDDSPGLLIDQKLLFLSRSPYLSGLKQLDITRISLSF